MFCISCGTKLPDDARFCFQCGATVLRPMDGIPQDEVQPSVTQGNRSTSFVREKPVNKLIVGTLYQKFKDMAEMLAGNYISTLDQRYNDSFDLFIQNSKTDVDAIFSEVEQYILSFFQEHGVYHLNLSDIRQETRDLVFYWPELYKKAFSVYQGIVEDEQSKREYRNMRKAGRSKMIGGGFGLSGAMKGAAAAGAVNMTTGVFHSLANAMGNAASAAEASSKKKAFYQSQDFRDDIMWSIQEDCKSMQEAITILWEENRPDEPQIPFYGDAALDQANNVAEALKENTVPDHRKESAVQQMIELYPVGIEYYQLAERILPHLKAEYRRKALEYGINLEEDEIHREALSEKLARNLIENPAFKLLGEYADHELDQTLYNCYYHMNDMMDQKFAILPAYVRDQKIYSRVIEVMKEKFASLRDGEIPILLAGGGVTSAGNKGILMTDQRLYLDGGGSNRNNYLLSELARVESSISGSGVKKVVFNGKEQVQVFCTEQALYSLVAMIIFLRDYVLYIYNLRQKDTNISFLESLFRRGGISESAGMLRSVDGLIQQNLARSTYKEEVTQENVATDWAAYSERIKALCASFLAEHDEKDFLISGELLFNLGVNETETVFLGHDDTLMKTGKNGFALTDRGIYCKDLGRNSVFTSYEQLRDSTEIRKKMSALYADNQIIVYFTGRKILNELFSFFEELKQSIQ